MTISEKEECKIRELEMMQNKGVVSPDGKTQTKRHFQNLENLESLKAGSSKMFDCNGRLLEAGQVCRMKYGGRRESKVGYYVGIEPINLRPNDQAGLATLSTFIPGAHGAWLHHYWAGRLEIIGTLKSHGYLLKNQPGINANSDAQSWWARLIAKLSNK